MLEKIFIKDYKNTTNPEVRFKYGIFASVFGIITNILLFIAKLVIGLISGSIAIVSDAINNLTDGASSIISFFGFKLASKPADKEHPFGHARYEYITGLLVAVLICMIGVLLCKSSIEKIINPMEITVNLTVCIILLLSILVKVSQLILYYRISRAINSDTIKANAIDARNDIIVTFATFIAMIVIWITGSNIDGYVGAGVSIFVIISGIKVLIETINPLLGVKPDKDFVKKIKTKLRSYDGVLGTHELMLHSYGQGRYFASVHVEVSADVDPMKTHDIIDRIEEDFLNELGINLVIHTDPIQNNNKEVQALKRRALSSVKKLNNKLSIHDFRVVKGENHTNLVFDVIVPFEVNVTKQDIIKQLNKEFNNGKMTYNFVLDIDRNYV